MKEKEYKFERLLDALSVSKRPYVKIIVDMICRFPSKRRDLMSLSKKKKQ